MKSSSDNKSRLVKNTNQNVPNQRNLNIADANSLLTLFENSDEGIWSQTIGNELVFANNTFRNLIEELFGHSLDAIIKNASDLPPEMLTEFKDIFRKVIAGDIQQIERTFFIKNNKRTFDIHIYPVLSEANVVAIAGRVREITEIRNFQYSLKQISSDFSTEEGESFFQSVARHLSEHFGSEYVLIGSLEAKGSNKLIVQGLYYEGKPESTKEYELQDSPVEFVFTHGELIIEKDIQRRFVQDAFLSKYQIESFVGVPILNHKNVCIGVVAIMFIHPLKKASLIENVLRIFAIRATAELERLLAEEEIYQQEANLKALIENAQEAIWAVDDEYRIIVVNEAFKRLFSFFYGVEISKGMRMIDHFPEKAKEAWMNRFHRALQGEQFIMERRYYFGEDYMDTEVSINPIIKENGSVSGVSYFSRDITHRKRSEEAIIKSEKRYRTLIETMYEGLVFADNHGIIKFVNRQLCTMIGYSENELIGKKGDIFTAGPEMTKLMFEKIALRKVGIASSYEMLFTKKNKETFWALVNGIPLMSDDGEFTGSMATISDISELKRTEEILKSTNQELNTFIYKSSHDIKGPLSSILGLTELAQKDLKDDISQNYLGMIRQSALRLDKILLDLLDTIRIKEGVLRPEEFDFNDALSDILMSLQHSPGHERLIYSQKINYSAPFYTDRNILRSILQNLIENALKYQDYNKENIEISITINDFQDGVKVLIEDNGQGIKAEFIDKIFDMFYRANLETKGTGLGLYIVKNAIKRLGGQIWVESEEDKGSKFHFAIKSLSLTEGINKN